MILKVTIDKAENGWIVEAEINPADDDPFAVNTHRWIASTQKDMLLLVSAATETIEEEHGK